MRITELDVIEDIKGLDAEFEREPLGDSCVLHECQIHLPRGQGANDTVAGVAKSKDGTGKCVWIGI